MLCNAITSLTNSLIFDKLLGTEGEDGSIVVVVTPLTAIMKDQVSVCVQYAA